MFEQLDKILPAVFAVTTVLYLWLSVRVSRATMDSSNSTVSYLLFFIGMMTAGSALAYNATDPYIYGIGRTLIFSSAGFLPVALYSIYREFTLGKAPALLIAVLCIIPAVSTVLAMTNELHNLIWSVVETDGESRFTRPNENLWFSRVHGPFAYGLFGFSLIAMASRLPTIARAHRKKIVLLLVCAI
ncbi:MAG: histidine kinase N-terminal 7TM domain-containing protein, partial [Woeseiaceae bacterium]|nr:histidine kinase N-terminal 7TM domain-containing protein [Woeseiaceae bacterium]